MADPRTEIRDALAAAALATAKALGVQIQYDHRDADDPLTLWAIPTAESQELAAELGLSAERTARSFNIPRQTDWPPDDNPAVGDGVIYADATYRVRRWQDDSLAIVGSAGFNPMGMESLGAVYKVSCERTRVVRIGAAA